MAPWSRGSWNTRSTPLPNARNVRTATPRNHQIRACQMVRKGSTVSSPSEGLGNRSVVGPAAGIPRWAANLAGMDRAEAEAVYDSGREACVEFILRLAGRVEQHEDRLRRLEEQARPDSRTSSEPPSMDPPKTRAERRAEARAKAKGADAPGGRASSGWWAARASRCGSRTQSPRIRWMRSSISIRMRVADADVGLMIGSAGRADGSVAIRSASCRRSA